MTTEELLKPRYKVIADYPFSDFKVGDILNQDKKREWLWEYNHSEISKPHAYPHIFKELQWWEERKENDMPEYLEVTPNEPRYIGKVFAWRFHNSHAYCRFNNDPHDEIQIGLFGNYIPATKEDFLKA